MGNRSYFRWLTNRPDPFHPDTTYTTADGRVIPLKMRIELSGGAILSYWSFFLLARVALVIALVIGFLLTPVKRWTDPLFMRWAARIEQTDSYKRFDSLKGKNEV